MIKQVYISFVTLFLIGSVTIDCEAGELFDNLSATLSYKGTYDNNILRYSDQDRDNFENGTEFYVSPTQTLDDLRNDVKVSLASRFHLFPDRYTRISLTSNFAGYLINSIQNFGWLSFTARQDISKQIRLSGNYFYEPRYFIRDYNDINTDSRQHCEFAMSQWKGELRYRPSKVLEFTGVGLYKLYAYNEYFTEYDSDFIQFGLETAYTIGQFRLSGGYHYAQNDNVGFNYSQLYVNSTEDSESGQGDYEMDQYDLSVRYRFKLLGKQTDINIESSLADRYYSTERDPTIDPLHHGRRDVSLSTELRLSYSYNKLFDIEFGGSYNNRNSRASDSIVSRVKPYHRWISWVEISYQLW